MFALFFISQFRKRPFCLINGIQLYIHLAPIEHYPGNAKKGVTNALLELDKDGWKKALPGEKYYVPGSILKTTVDQDQPCNWGRQETADVMFNNSPVFKLKPQATG